MKKAITLILTIILTIILYLGFYFLLVANATGEKQLEMQSALIVALFFTLIGIPIGIGLTWLLRKNTMEKSKKDLIIIGISAVWGILFGWLSLTGVAIGQYSIETIWEEREANTATN